MYQPNYFEEKRTEVIHALMRAHPLAALVAATHDGLVANHIPLDIRPVPAPFGTLRGHIAKVNPLWKIAGDTVRAVAIFQGPQGYVSPSWYPSKQQDAKVVPTWNYAVAHAHGTLRFIHDAAWLREFLEALTSHNESGRPHPWWREWSTRSWVSS
ncbi:MAG: FMN-binding negative transcriptional regulator [Gammaproteobacteria bacterium]